MFSLNVEAVRSLLCFDLFVLKMLSEFGDDGSRSFVRWFAELCGIQVLFHVVVVPVVIVVDECLEICYILHCEVSLIQDGVVGVMWLRSVLKCSFVPFSSV